MYKLKKILKAKPKDFPLKDKKKYEKANASADKKEKKQDPKGYKSLKKLSKKMPPKTIMGHINKKGKVQVSKVVPKSLRKEVVEHDKNERKYLMKHSNKK